MSAEGSARDERPPWGPPPELGGRAFQALAGSFLGAGGAAVLLRAPRLSIWKVERKVKNLRLDCSAPGPWVRPDGLGSLGRYVLVHQQRPGHGPGEPSASTRAGAQHASQLQKVGHGAGCPQVTQELVRSLGTPAQWPGEVGGFSAFLHNGCLPRTAPFLAPALKLQISPHDDTTGLSRITERDLLPPTTLCSLKPASLGVTGWFHKPKPCRTQMPQ